MTEPFERHILPKDTVNGWSAGRSRRSTGRLPDAWAMVRGFSVPTMTEDDSVLSHDDRVSLGDDQGVFVLG